MANDDCDLGARAVEDHQKERGALSAGEIFIIKMLQAVSGGALVGALFQTDTLIDLAGIGSFLVFLSAMSLAFVLAVFAAYWKYQCNMYEAKAVAIDSAAERQRWTKISL